MRGSGAGGWAPGGLACAGVRDGLDGGALAASVPGVTPGEGESAAGPEGAVPGSLPGLGSGAGIPEGGEAGWPGERWEAEREAAERELRLAVLAARGERLVGVRADGLCVARALLEAAGGQLAVAGGQAGQRVVTGAAEVFEVVAGYLEDREDWGDLEQQAGVSWADDRARAAVARGGILPGDRGYERAYQPVYSGWLARWASGGVTAEVHAQLVGDLRETAGGRWDSGGADLALAVAARVFGLAVTVVDVTGAEYSLTSDGAPVTVVRTSMTHWDAAVPVGRAAGRRGGGGLPGERQPRACPCCRPTAARPAGH